PRDRARLLVERAEFLAAPRSAWRQTDAAVTSFAHEDKAFRHQRGKPARRAERREIQPLECRVITKPVAAGDREGDLAFVQVDPNEPRVRWLERIRKSLWSQRPGYLLLHIWQRRFRMLRLAQSDHSGHVSRRHVEHARLWIERGAAPVGPAIRPLDEAQSFRSVRTPQTNP